MYIKKGVSIRGLQPEMVVALLILSDLFGGDYVLTSGTEPAPGRIPTSLHPKGLAIDIRIPTQASSPNSLSDQNTFRAQVSGAFEDTDFDVVWYDNHVHIEFDPKP